MPIFSQIDLQRLQQESQEPGARRARASFIDQAFSEQKSSAETKPAIYDINNPRPLPAVPVAVAESAAKPAVAEPKKKKIIRIDLTPHKRNRE